jgi:CheY-like chemotaxis protein
MMALFYYENKTTPYHKMGIACSKASRISHHQEQIKLRRVLHDLKQPVALMMAIIDDDPIDNKLLYALCLQLSARIKGVNELHSLVKPYIAVGIHDMLESIANGYKRLFTARLVTFEFISTIPSHLVVYALPDLLDRAVENLLSNANKYTSDGGNATMYISHVHKKDNTFKINIEVKDNGKGLDMKTSKLIWKEKYKGQFDSVGSGMGLPSVRAFALAEGGEVWGEQNDEPCGGCTVGFSFTTTAVDNSSVDVDTLARTSTLSDESLEVHTVLLVEDDPLQMKVNLKKLKMKARSGTIIHLASEGNEGLDKLRNQMYDAVITDMNMPVMDGATMIRKAREEGCLPAIVKLLSAQTFPKSHFDSYNITSDMMYDKTNTKSNVFEDVVRELCDR